MRVPQALSCAQRNAVVHAAKCARRPSRPTLRPALTLRCCVGTPLSSCSCCTISTTALARWCTERSRSRRTWRGGWWLPTRACCSCRLRIRTVRAGRCVDACAVHHASELAAPPLARRPARAAAERHAGGVLGRHAARRCRTRARAVAAGRAEPRDAAGGSEAGSAIGCGSAAAARRVEATVRAAAATAAMRFLTVRRSAGAPRQCLRAPRCRRRKASRYCRQVISWW